MVRARRLLYNRLTYETEGIGAPGRRCKGIPFGPCVFLNTLPLLEPRIVTVKFHFERDHTLISRLLFCFQIPSIRFTVIAVLPLKETKFLIVHLACLSYGRAPHANRQDDRVVKGLLCIRVFGLYLELQLFYFEPFLLPL